MTGFHTPKFGIFSEISYKTCMKRFILRVGIQGVKSLGSHFACLCRGFDFYEVKKNWTIIFEKKKWKYFYTFNHSFREKSSKKQIAQITQYDPWSAGINLRSNQSDLTPRILTLFILLSFDGFFSKMFSHPFYRKPATCFATSGWHNFPASDFRRVAKENHPFLQLLELSGIPNFKFLIIRSTNNHIIVL